MEHLPEGTDLQSGYRSSDGIYHSKSPPVRIPDTQCLDLTSFVFDSQFGDKKAILDVVTGRYLTFELLERGVRVLAAGLYRDLGVRQYDVVMLLSLSCVEFPVIFLAVLSLGAVVTTMNPVNTAGEIRKQMKDSGTKFVITTGSLLEKVAGIDQPVVVFGDDEVALSFRSSATHRFSELLRADPKDLPRFHITQDDTAALLYSSGTTGTSKGVVITHRNFISSISIVSSLRFPDQICLLVLPMFHIFGLVHGTLSTLFCGLTLLVLPRYDFVKMLTAIQTYKATYLPLVPPIMLSLTKQDLVFKFDLSSLNQIMCAAAPLGKEIMDTCAKRFPKVKLQQGYALTESTCAGTISPLTDDIDDMAAHFGSCGILNPNMEAMVISPATNKPMLPNEQGELWIRGPSCIMKGYLNNPKATSETVDKDGWLHTGDLVLIDRDGYVFVLDRLKELIKYNSNQVAPAELEALLLSHPAIQDCAVIPYPDEKAGQIPMGYIVRKPGQELNEDEVMEWVAKQVAPYKKVRRVAFINAIPKSAAGKILRRELVQLATTKPRF